MAVWFGIFRFTLLHGRAFSATGLALATVCVFVLARRRTGTAAALLAAGFFLLTPQVLDTGTVIRPDSWTAATVGGAMVAYVFWLETGRRSPLLLSAVGSGIAVLVHPLGAIALGAVLAHGALTRRRQWRAYLVHGLVAVATPLIVWGAYVAGHWDDFAIQMELQSARKDATFDLLFLANGPRENLLVELVVAVAVCSVVLAWRRADDLAKLAAVWTVVAVVAVTLGHEQQYPLLAFMPGAVAGAWALPLVSGWRSRVIPAALILSVVIGTAHSAVTFARSAPVSRTVAMESAMIPSGADAMLGPGAAAVYFGIQDRERLRSYVPVPVPPGTQTGIARHQHLLVMSAPPDSRPPQDAPALELDDLSRHSAVVDAPHPLGVWRVSS